MSTEVLAQNFLMSYEKKFHKYQHKIIFFSQENIYSQNHLAF